MLTRLTRPPPDAQPRDDAAHGAAASADAELAARRERRRDAASSTASPWRACTASRCSTLPTDLYIPPDALEVFLEAFEGPLDLLLYLIRKQNFNILDIPLASVTRQYLAYVEQIRKRNLELAATTC